MLRVDNRREIFVAENVTATSCIRHMNLRHKKVNKYIKDGVVMMVFMKFIDNDNKILTKNLSGDLHEK